MSRSQYWYKKTFTCIESGSIQTDPVRPYPLNANTPSAVSKATRFSEHQRRLKGHTVFRTPASYTKRKFLVDWEVLSRSIQCQTKRDSTTQLNKTHLAAPRGTSGLELRVKKWLNLPHSSAIHLRKLTGLGQEGTKSKYVRHDRRCTLGTGCSGASSRRTAYRTPVKASLPGSLSVAFTKWTGTSPIPERKIRPHPLAC